MLINFGNGRKRLLIKNHFVQKKKLLSVIQDNCKGTQGLAQLLDIITGKLLCLKTRGNTVQLTEKGFGHNEDFGTKIY